MTREQGRGFVPLILALVLLTMMYSRGRLQRIPAVDAISLAVSGFALAIALRPFFPRR